MRQTQKEAPTRAPAELAAGGAPAEADRSLPELRGDAVYTAHPAGCSRVRVLALRLPCGRGAGRGAGHRQRHQLLVPRPKACPSLSGATGPLRTAKQSSCCHVARAVGGTRSAWWGQPRDDVRTHVYASKSPLLMASISCSVTLMISCFRARGKDRAGEDGAGATGSPARGEGGAPPHGAPHRPTRSARGASVPLLATDSGPQVS